MGMLDDVCRGTALGNQCAHDGTTDHATVTGDVDFVGLQNGNPSPEFARTSSYFLNFNPARGWGSTCMCADFDKC
jgi:hypothetical protein